MASADNPIMLANSHRPVTESHEETRCLPLCKSTKWKLASVGLGIGYFGTIGLTTFAISIIGLCTAGIGLIAGGAVLAVAFAVGSAKAWKKAKEAAEGEAYNLLSEAQKKCIDELDGKLERNLLWNPKNKLKLMQAMVPLDEETSCKLCKAVRDFNALRKSSRFSEDLCQRYFDGIIDKPQHAASLYNGLVKAAMINCAEKRVNALIKNPEQAEQLAGALDYISEIGLKLTPKILGELTQNPNLRKVFDRGQQDDIFYENASPEEILSDARILAQKFTPDGNPDVKLVKKIRLTHEFKDLGRNFPSFQKQIADAGAKNPEEAEELAGALRYIADIHLKLTQEIFNDVIENPKLRKILHKAASGNGILLWAHGVLPSQVLEDARTIASQGKPADGIDSVFAQELYFRREQEAQNQSIGCIN